MIPCEEKHRHIFLRKITGDGLMKNLILTTASVLVLSAFAAQDDNTNMNDSSIPDMMDVQKPALAADSSSEMMQVQPADGSQMMQQHAPGKSSDSSKMMKHKGKKHHKGSKHHHGLQYPKETEINGVFVTFPPMDLNLCKPQNFCGKPECPYVSYEGYFWYPEARQNMLAGYNPVRFRGTYWYPSHMHPHMVYTTKTPVVYTHPYVLN